VEIREKISVMSVKERSGYILMDRILPPPFKNVLVRNGEMAEADVVSELGVYGIFIRYARCIPVFRNIFLLVIFMDERSMDGKEVLNRVGGHLLRTKTSTTNEGGVAAGFAVIDSPVLF
jgi:glutathione synthase